MEELQRENEWLWRKYAERDRDVHDEYCTGGYGDVCFWCKRDRASGVGCGYVTDEDIVLFKECAKKN